MIIASFIEIIDCIKLLAIYGISISVIWLGYCLVNAPVLPDDEEIYQRFLENSKRETEQEKDNYVYKKEV